MSPPAILELDAAAARARLEPLTRLLCAVVDAGGAVGMMAPLAPDAARRFWRDEIAPAMAGGARRLWIAEDSAGGVVGAAQLIVATPPNQPHRCEVAKLMTRPDRRRAGIARLLMTRLLAEAEALDRGLITLDTRSGDAAEALYAALGFQIAGRIPGYALDPDGGRRHATTYMYRELPPRARP